MTTELIKVDYTNETPRVSGRELHQVLEVATDYSHWFPRMCEYGFIEGIDFTSFLSESTGGRPATDHQLTVEMAKEILENMRRIQDGNSGDVWVKMNAVTYQKKNG